MPRIAASLVAMATLALCIGLNTVRYPIVWEMVAPDRSAPSAKVVASQATPYVEEHAESSAQPARIQGATSEPQGDASTTQGAFQEADAALGFPTPPGDNPAYQDPFGRTDRGVSPTADERFDTSRAEVPRLNANYAGYSGYADGSFLPAASEGLPAFERQTIGNRPANQDVLDSPAGAANYWPAQVVPAVKYSAMVRPGSGPAANQNQLPMVAIDHRQDSRLADATSASPVAVPVSLAGEHRNGVDRLPPTDLVTTGPTARPSVFSTPPLVYPSTGL